MIPTIVTVTEEHITLGEPNSIRECPIALALLDAGASDPYVLSDYWYDGDNSPKNELDARVQAFITDFDKFGISETIKPRAESTRPFTFTTFLS